MFGLVTLETIFALAIPEDRGRHEVDRRIYEIATIHFRPRAVLLSDSVSYSAIESSNATETILDLSSNQSITVAGNEFFLHRLLTRLDNLRLGATEGMRVVYAVNPISFNVDLDASPLVDTYFTSVFTQSREVKAVETKLFRTDIARRMERDSMNCWLYPPSYLRRGILQRPLISSLRAGDQWRRGNERPPEAPTPDALRRIAELSNVAFSPSETSSVFLREMSELCRKKDIELVIVRAPVPPSLLAAWDTTGFTAAFKRFLKQELAENDRAKIILSNDGPKEDAAFYDGMHMLPSERRRWGSKLVTYLISEQVLASCPDDGRSYSMLLGGTDDSHDALIAGHAEVPPLDAIYRAPACSLTQGSLAITMEQQLDSKVPEADVQNH